MQTVDPDRMLCSAISDLGLHCLPVTFFQGLYTGLKNGQISLNYFVCLNIPVAIITIQMVNVLKF